MSPTSAVVVGGSLSGLTTGLALARAGLSVTILERAAGFARTGAAIGIGGDRLSKLARLTGSRPPFSTNYAATSWHLLHAWLRTAAEASPRIELRHGVVVKEIDQNASSAWALASDGRRFHADVLIGADGHRSVVRSCVSPEHPDATFAGYLIWLGLAEERAIPRLGRWPDEVAFLGGADEYLFGYPVPGADGSLKPGYRQLGWALYDANRNDLLRATGCVVDNVVRHSLAASEIPASTFLELAQEARRWPSPWREAMLDSIERRSIVGTPIAEYFPDRLVSGRLAIVGDAAHVPTPMTGMGFATSLDDAEALAESLAGAASPSIPQALGSYERKRLSAGQSLVRSGMSFSRGFAAR